MERIRASLFWFAQSLTRQHKKAILWMIDVFLAPLSLLVVVVCLHHTNGLLGQIARFLWLFVLIAMISGAVSILLRLPWIKLKSYETYPFRLLPLTLLVGGALMTMTRSGAVQMPVLAVVTFALIFLCASYGARLGFLQLLLWALRKNSGQIRVLIYGAGNTGIQLASALKMHEAITVVGFIDDDSNLRRLSMAGLKIYPAEALESLVQNEDVSRIILAIPSASRPRQVQLARKLQALKVEVQIVPSFAQLVGAEDSVDRLTLLTPEQFLGREALNSCLAEKGHFYRGKVVMVTGAGGSIGSEICRQLLRDRPKRLVLFELSELALYNIDQELSPIAQQFGIELVPALGSVANSRMVSLALQDNAVEIVLHAAAYKHVPLVEANPLAGVSNNVMGTRILADACVRAGVERFLLISTDKAVRPTNIMGASKRLAEMVIQSIALRHPQTGFAIVRFGNVLGSSGSVIPLFKEQIARGGPVTLTHNDVTRYFMTITEAVSLVLLAGALHEEKETACADVFVLDMGKPVRIRDLAEQLIREAGYSLRDEQNPNGDIEIEVTGLRPGEKLYEELLIGADMANTPHPKIKRAAEAVPADISMPKVLHELSGLISSAEIEALRKYVFEIVGADKTLPETAPAKRRASR